ncbi:hypothetical protein KI387_025675, partial [Taxus chinensis]
MVPNPLAVRVAIVEDTYVNYWCDRCFMTHAPCEEDQQEEEADDGNDDDVFMMGCSMSSQQGETSTE